MPTKRRRIPKHTAPLISLLMRCQTELDYAREGAPDEIAIKKLIEEIRVVVLGAMK